MKINFTKIVDKKIGVEEQTAYGFTLIPPSLKTNMITNGWGLGHYSQLSATFKSMSSTTQGGYIHFRFRGRRIGVILAKMKGYGKLSFDIDGTDYGQYDTSFADWYQSNTAINYNVPFVIATDLPEGEHLLTITKPDALNTAVQGFLVDDAGHAPQFSKANFNYHEMLETTGIAGTPLSVPITYTTLRNTDTWIYSATFTNTTASPINITMKNGNGAIVVGPFPIPANDVRQLQGPIFLGGTSQIIASATGVICTIGGQ